MAQLKEGSRVQGSYFGKWFQGTVCEVKYTPVARLLYVDVDTPIVLPSMKNNKQLSTFERIVIDQNIVSEIHYEEN